MHKKKDKCKSAQNESIKYRNKLAGLGIGWTLHAGDIGPPVKLMTANYTIEPIAFDYQISGREGVRIAFCFWRFDTRDLRIFRHQHQQSTDLGTIEHYYLEVGWVVAKYFHVTRAVAAGEYNTPS